MHLRNVTNRKEKLLAGRFVQLLVKKLPEGHPNQQINHGFMTPQGAPMTPPNQFGTPQTTPGPMAFW
jgi:hypothetical protein